jgi:tRNA(adenine34) deaminase
MKNTQSSIDAHWMERALDLAVTAQQIGEVPVGAVLIDGLGKKVLGEGYNQVIRLSDPTAHAELVAIRAAAAHCNNYRLAESTLYVTLEPCAMCAGALVHARVKRVVIATAEPRAGAAGSVFNLLDNPNLNHRCEVCFGPSENQSAQLLSNFFREKRNQNKYLE